MALTKSEELKEKIARIKAKSAERKAAKDNKSLENTMAPNKNAPEPLSRIDKVKALQATSDKKVATKVETTELATVSAIEASEMKDDIQDFACTDEAIAIDSFNYVDFENNLMSLASKMEDQVPRLFSILKIINDDLRQFPELSHLLTDEQVGIIVDGTMVKCNIVVVGDAAKKKATKKPKKAFKSDATADILSSLDDLMKGGGDFEL